MHIIMVVINAYHDSNEIIYIHLDFVYFKTLCAFIIQTQARFQWAAVAQGVA